MKRILLLTILAFTICFESFGQKETTCPNLKVISASDYVTEDDSIVFTAQMDDVFESLKLEFNWTISKGTISKGQGTSVIEFEATKEMKGQSVVATVEIKGLPEICKNTAFESIDVLERIVDPGIIWINEYGKIPFEVEKSKLNSFSIELQKQPYSTGFFQFFVTKKEKISNIRIRVKSIMNDLKKSGIDKERISFVVYKSETNKTTAFLIPPGCVAPSCYSCEEIKISKI